MLTNFFIKYFSILHKQTSTKKIPVDTSLRGKKCFIRSNYDSTKLINHVLNAT